MNAFLASMSGMTDGALGILCVDTNIKSRIYEHMWTGIYRVEWFKRTRMRVCETRHHTNIYRAKPVPKWQRVLMYIGGCIIITVLSVLMLRDTTPVQFVEPSRDDLNKPMGDIVNRAKIDDVYWRVSMRHIGTVLDQVCASQNYTVLTHKNIILDGSPMQESYIHLCERVSDLKAVVNARAVITNAATKTANCIETYANIKKRVVRRYPFSLKYISAETFVDRTKVIRTPAEACVWQHAIDIVNSVWE